MFFGFPAFAYSYQLANDAGHYFPMNLNYKIIYWLMVILVEVSHTNQLIGT